MEVQKILHMKGGLGQDSYANNSLLQRSATINSKPVLEASIKEVFHRVKPGCFMIADMGCSSGSNALLVVTEIINIIDDTCRTSNCKSPEFGVFLNDLPGNDFNTLFSFLPSFYKWVEQEKGSDFGCFVSGTPRSFYGRAFPNQFLHFVYSGYALHWLSQVPKELVSGDGVALNKGNINIAKTSPPEVQKAYYSQFKKDFILFLISRAEEIVSGGSMVLTFLGSIRSTDPHPMTQLLGFAIHDMVLEGIIEAEKLDRFNVPSYGASAEEVRELVEAEGSFGVTKLETFTVDWSIQNTHDLDNQAKFLVEGARVVLETLLVNAFGEDIIDDLFIRFKNKIQEHIAAGQPIEYVNILASLTRKN